jgi:hypothetical protein
VAVCQPEQRRCPYDAPILSEAVYHGRDLDLLIGVSSWNISNWRQADKKAIGDRSYE